MQMCLHVRQIWLWSAGLPVNRSARRHYDRRKLPQVPALKQFAADDEIELLQARMPGLAVAQRLVPLVALAWQLRQRVCRRALAVAEEAQALLVGLDPALPENRLLHARLMLVRAEVKLLFTDLATAQQWAAGAAAEFSALGDCLGQGDTRWLEASIALNRGQAEQVDACLNEAIVQFHKGQDRERVQTAMARRLVYLAFRDPAATSRELQLQFPEGIEYPTAVLAWLSAARANVLGLTGDPGGSIKHDLHAYQAALDSGQIRQALVSVTNAAESFATLGDLDAALEWSERALALARDSGWPALVGLCLMQMGDVMRQLERRDEARVLLQEALLLMGEQTGSRNHGQVLGNVAQLALDMGDFAVALESFRQLEEHVRLHQEPDATIKAWRGQASALAHLGRGEEAHVKAQAALALARECGNAHFEIQVLSVLADLHATQVLPEPEGLAAPSASLHYLNQALRAAEAIAGYTVAPELLNQVAAAYAACGEYRDAYANLLAADAARNKTRSVEAQKRALAMQIRNEIEQARAETELHRRQADALRVTTQTLETLGTIGREITASLDSGAVFEALHRHVHRLLDATCFAVYLIDAGGNTLSTAFGVEAGAPLPRRVLALDNPTSRFVRCALSRDEIVLDIDPDVADPNRIPGTLATLSLLYAPLLGGERLLGVMSIQSPKRNAYAERERSIFRALCAYGAIALDNAAAYGAVDAAQRELRQTQVQLVAQNSQLERLAATDQLTGLSNRLRLTQALEEEASRGRRYATGFCILLLDVDHFKMVNDVHGHPVGDQVLIGIASVLREGIREVDIAGRWGGEEFMVLCRETTLEGAMVLAEKLRSAIHACEFESVGRKSASLGVASFRPGESLAETIARADAALYRAKDGGRNRVDCVEPFGHGGWPAAEPQAALQGNGPA